MFTGIVEEMGTVHALVERDGGWHLTVVCDLARQGTRLGDSIAVDGVCLTVTAIEGERLTFGLAPETLARTNLGDRAAAHAVNLERAMAADGRFGGHMVQGHIDGTGAIESVAPDGDSIRYGVTAPAEILRYIVPKGFIAVDGVSLTVIDADNERFTFMLIAHTRTRIAFPQRPLGSRINLEVDLVAKYVERLLKER